MKKLLERIGALGETVSSSPSRTRRRRSLTLRFPSSQPLPIQLRFLPSDVVTSSPPSVTRCSVSYSRRFSASVCFRSFIFFDEPQPFLFVTPAYPEELFGASAMLISDRNPRNLAPDEEDAEIQ
ncbi:unnamed protein product [Vicia faba]|uniref:Uncharacterized protein n=1 Tax=Vicia faba TaxID=3906 RepID=A0AAV1ANG1_VICFA|nr:unnamed protein product [Vicia faba]